MTEALKKEIQQELGPNTGSRRYRGIVDIALALELRTSVVMLGNNRVSIASQEAIEGLHALDDAGWKRAYGLYTNRLSTPTARLTYDAVMYLRSKIAEHLTQET